MGMHGNPRETRSVRWTACAAALACVAFVAALLGFSGDSHAARPTVESTEPAHGAVGVDPDTRQIVVRFDRPMNTRVGWSIVGGGDNFPELRAKPRWNNPRTMTIPVRLKPNHAYRLSLNNESFQNFRSREGQPLVPYPLQFQTGPAGGAADEPDAQDDDNGVFGPRQAEAMTRELRTLIDQSYSYRARVVNDWDAVFEENAQVLRSAASPAGFAGTASILLSAAKDKHLWLDVDGTRFPTFRDPPVGNVNEQSRAASVPNYTRFNRYVATGRFEDGTLYAAIDGLNDADPRAYEPFFELLGKHGDGAPGLILDLRANGGGSERVAWELAGCLIDGPTLYAKNVNVAPDRAGGFTEVLERTFDRNWGRPSFRGPVAVLTGRRTMSSAEAFTLMLKQVPGARSFGAATQGSSGNPKPYALGHGVTVFLPSWRAMTAEGVAFEGVGIAPDETVVPRPGARGDAVLDAARDWLDWRSANGRR
ncbi:MAG: S41 family peptidase [Planctomycetota bacterium]